MGNFFEDFIFLMHVPFFALSVTYIFLYFITYIATSISLWKIFTEAKQEGWEALIPIYRVIVLLDVINKPRWWIFLLLWVPFANVYFYIKVMNCLALLYNKTSWFAFGLVLLPFIYLPILAFRNAKPVVLS